MERAIETIKENSQARYYKCPVCGFGEVRVDKSVYYGRCGECGATMINYQPSEHQMEAYESTCTYKLYIGGFGSGKTTEACFEDAVHVITIPNARLLITAQTLQQVKEAVLPELRKFIPPWLLVGGKPKGNPPKYTFINGSEIVIIASDDPDKIRSMNLTAFHIEEASGVPFEVFQICQTRMRNSAAVIYDDAGHEVGDRFQGILSTNPEDGWIKDDFLLRSAELHGSKTVDLSLYQKWMADEREAMYASFISTTFDNPFLPRGTIERISAGRDVKWKRKYLYSILDVKEGLVYPELADHYVEPFDIPQAWPRLGGYDPGIADPTACLIGAIDPLSNTIYFYFDYDVTDRPIAYHGEKLVPEIKPYKFLYPIQADPSVKARAKETGRSYKDYFYAVTGIRLQEANNDILFGISKVKDYIHAGKIKIFNNLLNFKDEASKYQFARVRETSPNKDKPLDKYNHLMDCLRYAISPLPQNPLQFRGVVLPAEVRSTHSYYKNIGIAGSPVSGDESEKRVFIRKWGDKNGKFGSG